MWDAASTPIRDRCAFVRPPWRAAALLLAGVVAWHAGAQSPSVEPATSSSPMTDAPADDSPAQTMEAVRVSASRASASEVESAAAIETYDADHIRDTGAFDMDEFFETLPPGDEDGEQLVLIDGRPTYIDPSTLPPGMIEAVEVSVDGSMPAYGAYASGRIINLRLKKDYRGAEFGAKGSDTFAGGGAQESAKLSGGAVHGKLRAIFSLSAQRRHSLLASERDSSREQDHTARGGRDLRLSWGYPAVVEAVSGNLNGLTDAAGNPVAVALVAENQDGQTLGQADFLPGSSTTAADQRRFNTAAYRMLASPSTRTGVNLSFTYALTSRIDLSLSGSHTASRSERSGAPPVTPPSEETVVPAAFNPFGQDVAVGLVHLEFGPTWEHSESDRSQVGLRLQGRVGETWKWDAGAGYRHNESSQRATDLDPEKFAPALADPDPARRFNPFGDARLGPINAHLYPELTAERTSDDTSRNAEIELSTDGRVFESWGGPAVVHLEFEYDDSRRERVSTAAAGDVASDAELQRITSSYETSGALTLPLIGAQNARPLLRRLETQLSGEYSAGSDDGSETDAELRLLWAPFKSLVLRARYSENIETPPRVLVSDIETLVDETVIDPRRGSMAGDVQIVMRDGSTGVSEKTTRTSFGATFEPVFLKGFRLSTSYDVRRQHDLWQNSFDAQDIVNNEAAFPGRVIRGEPSSEDLALGRPGPILAVDTSAGNAGQAERREIDFSLHYRVPWQQFGRIRLTATAERTLESRYEVLPGVEFIHEGVGRHNRPDWRMRGLLAWSQGPWSVSTRVQHTGEVPANAGADNAVAAYTTTDVSVGYRFGKLGWGKLGKDLRVVAGIGNVFDEPPPYADTISGYRGGSPLGRSYNLAFTLSL